jgi:hypothetical protein
MDKKYQVFISSTYKDLIEQRNQVVEVVLRLSHLPVGMEIFNAASATPWDVITSHIDNSDYYVLILAHRYGSEDPMTGVGYTEKEYDYAISRGIPCLAFVLQDGVQWNTSMMEEKASQKKKLVAFKRKIHVHHVSYWTSTDDLASKVLLAVVDETRNKPGIGWVRANAITTSPAVAEELSRLSKENSELKEQLASSVANQIDEYSELKRILSTVSYSIAYAESNNSYTLEQIFSSLCSSQEMPVASNILEWLIGTYGLQTKRDYEDFMPSLVELSLLGLVSKERNRGGSEVWVLTEEGKKLYARMKYPAKRNK